MLQEWIPVVGMKFETEKDAHEFYIRYAYKFGFGTRLSKAHTSSTGFLRDRLFVCSAEGKRERDSRTIYVKIQRAETRFNCGARMKISKTHRFRSHRKDIKDQAETRSRQKVNDDNDLKGKIAKRYRDLAQLSTELAIIAVESDEAYEIALNGLQKALADVKKSLRTRKKPPEDVSMINNTTHEVVTDELGEHTVKGIKTRAKKIRKEVTIRPKNQDCSNSSQNQQIPHYALQYGISMSNGLPVHPQLNSVVFRPGMQFTSPILHPNMQFASPYQHVQFLGGSNFGVSYQQGMTHQQPPSTSTISNKEHDLMNKNPK